MSVEEATSTHEPRLFEYDRFGSIAYGPIMVDVTETSLDIALDGITGVTAVSTRVKVAEIKDLRQDPCLDPNKSNVTISSSGTLVVAQHFHPEKRTMSHTEKLCATRRLAFITNTKLVDTEVPVKISEKPKASSSPYLNST